MFSNANHIEADFEILTHFEHKEMIFIKISQNVSLDFFYFLA